MRRRAVMATPIAQTAPMRFRAVSTLHATFMYFALHYCHFYHFLHLCAFQTCTYTHIMPHTFIYLQPHTYINTRLNASWMKNWRSEYLREPQLGFEGSSKACGPLMFRCENGPCIGNALRCNGVVDCPLDISDELDCNPRSNEIERKFCVER